MQWRCIVNSSLHIPFVFAVSTDLTNRTEFSSAVSQRIQNIQCRVYEGKKHYLSHILFGLVNSENNSFLRQERGQHDNLLNTPLFDTVWSPLWNILAKPLPYSSGIWVIESKFDYRSVFFFFLEERLLCLPLPSSFVTTSSCLESVSIKYWIRMLRRARFPFRFGIIMMLIVKDTWRKSIYGFEIFLIF